MQRIREKLPGRLDRTTAGHMSSGGERLSIEKANDVHWSIRWAGRRCRVPALQPNGAVLEKRRERLPAWEAVGYGVRWNGSGALALLRSARAHGDRVGSTGSPQAAE
jgi:hypothetical protein